MSYSVIVGNIGMVHEGNNEAAAVAVFNHYVRQSKSGHGRAGGEEVVMWENGEPTREYFPPGEEDAMTMTPGHARWDEFLERLEGPEGCNFTQEEPDDAGTIHWACQNDPAAARTILGTMEVVNVDASIGYFEGARAHCDCEILFNLEGGSDE